MSGKRFVILPWKPASSVRENWGDEEEGRSESKILTSIAASAKPSWTGHISITSDWLLEQQRVIAAARSKRGTGIWHFVLTEVISKLCETQEIRLRDLLDAWSVRRLLVEVSDARGAAASRLLFRFTLDPLLRVYPGLPSLFRNLPVPVYRGLPLMPRKLPHTLSTKLAASELKSLPATRPHLRAHPE